MVTNGYADFLSLFDYFIDSKISIKVWDVVAGTGHFIRRESLLGAVMVFPWLRHLPLISKQFNRSKSVGPLKMRKLQDDMVAIKQVTFSNKM